MLSKGQIVGINWSHIARLYSHVLAHMNSLTASRCHIKASHTCMNSLMASCHHNYKEELIMVIIDIQYIYNTTIQLQY